jgi:hypothetical protein
VAKRPDVFSQPEFESYLRQAGCPESFVSPVTSDFRLFVPIALRALDERGLFEAVDRARPEFGLGPQEAAWRLAVKHIVGWAEDSLEQYKRAK